MPDLNRDCEAKENTTLVSMFSITTGSPNSGIRNMSFLRDLICQTTLYCLVWSLVQIAATNLMFYGIKSNSYKLFVPHLVLRLSSITITFFVESWVIFILTCGIGALIFNVIYLVLLSVLLIFWIYATWIEIRCAHFVKRSKETGFSISQARSIGPATLSISDREREQPQIIIRQLPPIRTNRNWIAGATFGK